MNKKITDFDVMSHMAGADMDISCTTTMVSAQSNTRGGHVTMGVSAECLHKLAIIPDKYVMVLYVMNKKEFFATKDKLINENEGRDQPTTDTGEQTN